MKLVFFNRFFYPDNSATSQMLSDLAFHLAKQGHDVHVVATGVRRVDAGSELLHGVTVHRVSAEAKRDAAVVCKAMDYVKYIASARRAAKALLGPETLCIVKTDPPLLASAIAGLSTQARAPFIVWLQDVFPEVAQRFGVPGMGGATGRALQSLRDRALRKASRVVVIADSMRLTVERCMGLEASRVSTIHNWADGQAITPIAHRQNPLRDRWVNPRSFVVGYSGNLGRVHEFDTLLGAAARLSADASIQFLIVGNGPRLRDVHEHVKRRGLTNVRFEPLQPRGELARSLSVPDVHIAVMRPEFEGLVHPSKIYGIMAAGRPLIFVGDPEGEAARMIKAHEFGLVIAPGDVDRLANAITMLRDSPKERTQMGRNARASFDSFYDMPIAVRQWEALLLETARGGSSSCYDSASR